MWELCSTSSSSSWQNDARGTRPCNKGQETTHCLVTLSENIRHAEIGTESRYPPLLDKSSVFDKTTCGLGWLRLWNLSNSLATWECGQSEKRENTLWQVKMNTQLFFFACIDNVCLTWKCISRNLMLRGGWRREQTAGQLEGESFLFLYAEAMNAVRK